MKTAMQQLIEHLDPIHSGIKQKAIELLEVEKEQIVKTYNDAIKEKEQIINAHMYSSGNSSMVEAEYLAKQYYNKTYKTNNMKIGQQIKWNFKKKEI